MHTSGVPFPPFSFFVEFVCAEARAHNDPRFHQPLVKRTGIVKATPMFINLTQLIKWMSTKLSHVKNLQKGSNEIDKECPIHLKSSQEMQRLLRLATGGMKKDFKAAVHLF